MRLWEHSIQLQGARVVLRPMTEDDWELLLVWNNDPDVLYWADDNDVPAYDLPTVQSIYRSVSQNATCFMIEYEGQPIGEGWLQRMNLPRILAKYPTQACYRIDLMIGVKAFWGQGLGTDTIRTITRFGFEQEKANQIFGLVNDYNTRSRRAFARAGYVVEAAVPAPPGSKTTITYDLVMTRTMWLADNASSSLTPRRA